MIESLWSLFRDTFKLISTLPSKGVFSSLFDGFSGKMASLRRFALPSEGLDFLASFQWSLDAASCKADPATWSNLCLYFLKITAAELFGFVFAAFDYLVSISLSVEFVKSSSMSEMMDFACLEPWFVADHWLFQRSELVGLTYLSRLGEACKHLGLSYTSSSRPSDCHYTGKRLKLSWGLKSQHWPLNVVKLPLFFLNWSLRIFSPQRSKVCLNSCASELVYSLGSILSTCYFWE